MGVLQHILYITGDWAVPVALKPAGISYIHKMRAYIPIMLRVTGRCYRYVGGLINPRDYHGLPNVCIPPRSS